MARGGRQRGVAPKGTKRKQQDDFFEAEEAADFFDEAQEEGPEDAGEDGQNGEDQEALETAEQKRLRLAKEYLTTIRGLEAAARGGDEDDADNDEAGGEEGLDAAVARRLRQETAEAMGWGQRALAARVVPPPADARVVPGQSLRRGHAASPTALALTSDDRLVYSVSKDGTLLRHDIEAGTRERLASGAAAGSSRGGGGGGAYWVAPAARQAPPRALLACAVSTDGVYVAAGGGDRGVHVWDVRTGGGPVKSFPGHKDAVTALTFRSGTHELFSGSRDRSVKIWSLDDLAYVDALFGHQAEVLGLSALRAERVVSCGADRTCRLWKVPEESQLILRGSHPVIECCAMTRGGEWVSGDAAGTLALWTAARKKPIATVKQAHVTAADATAVGSVGGNAVAGVLSIAACPASDLVATGAGDGAVRLWGLQQGQGGSKGLYALGSLPARGFVNGLAVAKSARFVAAALGQEPRLGRWDRDGKARNGIAILPLTLTEEPVDD